MAGINGKKSLRDADKVGTDSVIAGAAAMGPMEASGVRRPSSLLAIGHVPIGRNDRDKAGTTELTAHSVIFNSAATQ